MHQLDSSTFSPQSNEQSAWVKNIEVQTEVPHKTDEVYHHINKTKSKITHCFVDGVTNSRAVISVAPTALDR
jgi:hypothetical protein